LTNYGNVEFGSSVVTAGGGIVNYSTITVAAGNTLNVSAPTGLDNEATLLLSGGTVGGSGPIANYGVVSGNGTIGGTGGFINFGQVTANGVLALLGTSGAISNVGQIDVPSGSQLRLGSNPLQNTGTLNLGGGFVSSGSLSNLAGGTITGHGTIGSLLGTSSGNIVVSEGTLNIVNAMTNAGAIQVGGLTATLVGATITNSGTLQGFGTIANVIGNTTGSVEAVGGTLILSGAGSTSGGLIASSNGNKVLFTKGLASNAGTISLTGGTFDNGGNAISNTGQISGYGTFRSGGLTNNGSITLTGGTTTVNGNVTNAATRKVEVRYTPAIFTGTFTNNGIFKNTSAQVTFSGTYIENGTFLSDPADNFFQDAVIGVGGVWSGGLGDRFFVAGNLLNGSTAKKAWGTAAAELDFVGGGAHLFGAAGSDLGISFDGYEDNFAWGRLVLGAGDSLAIEGEAVYVGVLDLKGGVEQISSISGDGNIYYDLREPGNAYLEGKSYALAGGGMVVAVPEPGSVAGAVLMMGLCTRRRRWGKPHPTGKRAGVRA
jgi:hypothetical protein